MNETTDVTTILAPLWRRKWLILLIGVVVAGATYAYYKRQPAEFAASTALDLGSGSEAQQALSGGAKAGVSKNTLADAPSLITSSIVAEAVLKRLRSENPAAQARRSEVQAKVTTGTDFITITARGRTAKRAARLANDYAEAYIERQHLTYQREVRSAINSTRRQLRRVEAAQSSSSSSAPGASKGKGGKGTPATSKPSSTTSGSTVLQAASLASKLNQLESELGLPTVQQVNPATPHGATQLGPAPKKNAIFGFVIGILLGGLLVFVLSRVDRRIGSLAQLEAVFKAEILSALPRVSNPIVEQDGHPRPARALLEPLRRLHTSLQLAGMHAPGSGSSPRLILCLSAEPGDGRSTLVADLALVQRDAGARVAVLEADLRNPVLAKLLSVSPSTGLAEVLAGRASFDEAMQDAGLVLSPAPEESVMAPAGGVSTVLQAEGKGSLTVLPGGGPAANPPALLAGQAMQEVLRSATADYDYVLIDAPPPLTVSDVMPLLHAVDGILIVARLAHTREVSAERLMQLLARTPTAPVLGVVANAVSNSEIQKFGFSAATGEQRWPRRLIAR